MSQSSPLPTLTRKCQANQIRQHIGKRLRGALTSFYTLYSNQVSLKESSDSTFPSSIPLNVLTPPTCVILDWSEPYSRLELSAPDYYRLLTVLPFRFLSFVGTVKSGTIVRSILPGLLVPCFVFVVIQRCLGNRY